MSNNGNGEYMRIAVCFRGEIRTGNDVSFSLLNYLGDLAKDCDFFVHTWSTETISIHDPDYKEYTIQQIQNNKINTFYSTYTPKVMVVDDYSKIKAKMGMFYSIKQVTEIRKSWEKKHDVSYDFVINLRPDIIFHDSKKLEDDLKLVNYTNVVFADHHGRNKGWPRLALEDIMWIAKPFAMDNVVSFSDVILSDSYVLGGIDWQLHHKMYMDITFGYIITPMENNMCAIYRPSGTFNGGAHGHFLFNQQKEPSELYDFSKIPWELEN